jgi:rhodanese-related sulfurtransferase
MPDRDITPTELREKEGVQLIDVREDYEWKAGRMPGARHIELNQVAAQAASIDREKPVVFYCRVGARSAMAADAFRQAGYDAYSLDGGLLAWAGEGGALEPEDGSVAAH